MGFLILSLFHWNVSSFLCDWSNWILLIFFKNSAAVELVQPRWGISKWPVGHSNLRRKLIWAVICRWDPIISVENGVNKISVDIVSFSDLWNKWLEQKILGLYLWKLWYYWLSTTRAQVEVLTCAILQHLWLIYSLPKAFTLYLFII